ncbi:MAG: hypothetical protein GKS02_14225 [Alphaproteobacteria bacterium]|nr:hypothetical protein [Alphaproteobacteria bacterium]
MEDKHKYMFYFILTIIVVMFPLFMNYLMLRSAGEFRSLKDVAQYQQSTGALYGTGLHDINPEHRLEIIEARRPEIIALGSSRAGYFRQEFFTERFACACLVMSSIHDAPAFVSEMLSRHMPKLVLWNIDFWWFGGTRRAARAEQQNEGSVSLTRQKITKPFVWLRDGTISFAEYFEILVGNRSLNSITHYDKLGVRAVMQSVGTRSDGSTLHGAWTYGLRNDETVISNRRRLNSPNVILDVAKGGYAPDQNFRSEEFQILADTIGTLERAGVRVILMLPPVAPPIQRVMTESGRYRFVDSLSDKLGQLGVEYYDLRDSASYGSTVCEFLDIHHAGNTVYLRMLSEIVTRNPNSVLAGYVDVDWLKRSIGEFNGLIVAQFDTTKYGMVERDLYGFRCHDESVAVQ